MKKILKLTEDLIKIPSTKQNPEKLKEIADFCESFFSGEEFNLKRFEKNDKHSLVVTFKGNDSPELFLIGHLDVVEAEKDQFVPKKKGDKLYGRGAKDNKGPSAVIMNLMKDMAPQKPSVGLILTTDEESGGFDGINYLFNEENYFCKVALIPDGGDNFDIIFSEKGILHFKLVARGKEAHGARPWEGDNAIEKLIDAYTKLRSRFPNPQNKKEWKNSLNVGKVGGGTATNVVAGKAEMFLDLRFTEEWTEEEIQKEVKKIIGKEIEMEVISSGAPFYTSPDNPYVLKYKEALKKMIQKDPVFKKYPPASDARFLSAKNIPVIITNASGGGTHGKEEWVSISSLEALYNILKEFSCKS